MRVLAVLAAALVLAAPAAAALTVTTPATSSFTVTLNGVDQTGSFTLAMTVAATGTDKTTGWKLQAAATQFTAAGGKTFPADATSTASAVDDAGCTGGGCNNPTTNVALPVTLSTTSAPIYNAAVNTGSGTNVVTGTFNVAVPAKSFSGSYTSTLTITVVSGP